MTDDKQPAQVSGAEMLSGFAMEGLDNSDNGESTDSVRSGPDIHGLLEKVDSDGLHGWAFDANDPDRHLTLQILSGGAVVGEVVADVHRGDLAAEGIGDGSHAFAFRFSGGRSTPSDVAVVERESGTRINAWRLLTKKKTGYDQSESEDEIAPESLEVDIRGLAQQVGDEGIHGWAFDANDPGRHLTLQILFAGTSVGEVVADRHREELAAAGIGDGSHAFGFRFPRGSLPKDVTVVEKESGVRISDGREIFAGENEDDRFLGLADGLTPDTISGWAIDLFEKDRPLELAVYLGNQLIGRGRADKFRKDVFDQFGGHGFFGFSIKLNKQIFSEDFPRLRIATVPDEALIQIMPELVDRLRSAPSTPTDKQRSLKGYLDRADREVITGWAVDEQDTAHPVMVDIFVNDMLIRSTVAGLWRKDLVFPYPDSKGNLGFGYQVPFGVSLRGQARVAANHPATGLPLVKSPMTGNIGKEGLLLNSADVEKYRRNIRAAQTISYEPTAQTDAKVAAIVLNRDGADFLEALFSSIDRFNSYKNLELIIIDHGSVDASRSVCAKWQSKLAIRFVDRKRNYSYSASNNFGAALTDAEFLFFLNNDIQFDSDFIARALAYLKGDVGIVGFKLVSPPDQVRTANGLKRADLIDVGYSIDQVQHLGVRFTTAVGDRPFLPFEEPVNRENDSFSGEPMEVPGVTAAALLMRREDFAAVGGFHEEYFYGFEDVDFCMTFRELTKKKIVCLNNIKLYHFRSASIQKADADDRSAKAQNKTILLRRIGSYIKKQLKDERIKNTSFVRDTTISIAFAVSEASDTTSAGDYFTALEIAHELAANQKFECVFLEKSRWYDLKDFDVVVAMVEGFRPALIRSCRSDVILVAWLRNWFDRWLTFPELKEFDALWVSSEKAFHAFSAKAQQKVSIVRIATNVQRFEAGVAQPEYKSDYCFTGSYFGSWREIIGFLAPQDIPYTFALYGNGWRDIEWLQPYYRGPQPYTQMANIYASTKIVIDDANHTTLNWGSVNSRVFDAIAAGALVLTNSQTASDDAFDGLIPVFNSRETLTRLVKYYLDNDNERLELVSKLQAIVRKQHRYTHRASDVAADIRRLVSATSVAIQVPADATAAETLARQVETMLWKSGAVPHVLAHSSWPLSKARAFGADVDVRFTDMESVGDLSDVLPHRPNVLFVLCGSDDISRKEAKQIAERFDLVLTADEEIASTLRQAGCNAKGLASSNTNYSQATPIERRLMLQQLFDSTLPPILEALVAGAPNLGLKNREVKPSDGPSLSAPAAKDGNAEASTPLKIAYVLWDFPALSQTFVINEIRWLVVNGFDVKVYFKIEPDRAATLDFEVEQFKVSDAAELVELLVLHGRTVIHSPFAYPATVHLTYPAAQATGIPFTIMPAGVDISHFENMRRNRVAEITNSPLCIGVITIGNYHHRFLLEQGVPNSKIILERQAVDLPTRSQPGVHRRNDGARPRIISVARFIEKKGLRYLIEAAADLPDCDVVLYGYGPLEGELRALAERLNLSNVAFGGALESTADLWKAYDEADIFCLPCVRAVDGDLDGLPTVILEAMAAGIPVVSTDIANVPDVIVEGVTGFLAAPKNSEALAAALGRALSLDPRRRERLLDSARRKVKGYASVESTMHTLTRVWGGRGVDIILVTYDTGKYKNGVETEQILDRVFKNTSLPFQVYVVDNGSDEEFLKKLKANYSAYPNFHLITMGRNIWCGPASNIAIEQGKSDYIIYLCSKEGYVLRRGWEINLVKYMDENQEVGMAGHLVTMPASDGKAYQNYSLFSKFRNQDFARENPDRHFAHVQGGVFILRRQAYEMSGGFNLDVPQNGMDIEYSYFLESEGWKLGDIPNVYSATTLTLPRVSAMVDENAIVVHPLSTTTIGLYDRIISGEIKSCNICGWEGSRFAADDGSAASVCPNCNSCNFDRTVMRLLALAPNLQKKPKILAIVGDTSLQPILRQLSTDIRFKSPVEAVDKWPSRTDADLVIIDHRPWSAREKTDFIAWMMRFLADGGSVILGGGTGDDPLPALIDADIQGQPVLYDSVVREFDWMPVYAFNVDVHP